VFIRRILAGYPTTLPGRAALFPCVATGVI